MKIDSGSPSKTSMKRKMGAYSVEDLKRMKMDAKRSFERALLKMRRYEEAKRRPDMSVIVKVQWKSMKLLHPRRTSAPRRTSSPRRTSAPRWTSAPRTTPRTTSAAEEETTVEDSAVEHRPSETTAEQPTPDTASENIQHMDVDLYDNQSQPSDTSSISSESSPVLEPLNQNESFSPAVASVEVPQLKLDETHSDASGTGANSCPGRDADTSQSSGVGAKMNSAFRVFCSLGGRFAFPGMLTRASSAGNVRKPSDETKRSEVKEGATHNGAKDSGRSKQKGLVRSFVNAVMGPVGPF